MTDGVGEVEIAVTEGFLGDACVDPIVVHAKGTHDDFAVVFSQILVDGEYSFGFQFEENRIDDLCDVVAS